jgi:hypothetical protein
MKVMATRDEPGTFERIVSGNVTLLHRCPVCGITHEVSPVRAQFAYGRQLACSLDCESERRRRMRAAYRLTGLPSVPGPKLVSSRETPAVCGEALNTEGPGGRGRMNEVEPRISLCVTVEGADVLSVRRAVFQSVPESVRALKAVPVPHSSKVRLYVSMKASTLDAIRSAIIRAVPAGEFGRVGRA